LKTYLFCYKNKDPIIPAAIIDNTINNKNENKIVFLIRNFLTTIKCMRNTNEITNTTYVYGMNFERISS
jgi:hypothetical protein